MVETYQLDLWKHAILGTTPPECYLWDEERNLTMVHGTYDECVEVLRVFARIRPALLDSMHIISSETGRSLSWVL